MSIIEAMDVKARLANIRRAPTKRPRVLAFYLPQYHPIAENDRFWGEGFTDWDNVRKARPLFSGHLQPIMPSDEVGCYDLRDPSVLRQQAALARDHGVDGFVFHHYWFDGARVLDAPLRNWLADPTIDLPVALCWANEPWTRRWDGQPDDVLIPQEYGEGWAERFWFDVAEYLADPRYIRVNGAPMLVVYRAGQLPDAVGAFRTWRRLAHQAGHPGLHIVTVRPAREVPPLRPEVVAASDALVSFPPGGDIRIESVAGLIPPPSNVVDGDVMSYASAFESPLPAVEGATPVIPGVMPGWDNTARRGTSAYLFLGASPVAFARVLRTRARLPQDPRHESMVFVNAWNEWAEGATIEPSRRYGRGALGSVVDALGLPEAGP